MKLNLAALASLATISTVRASLDHNELRGLHRPQHRRQAAAEQGCRADTTAGLVNAYVNPNEPSGTETKAFGPPSADATELNQLWDVSKTLMAAKFTSPEETTIVSPPPRPPAGPVEGGEPVASAGGSTETTTTTTSTNTPTQAEPQSNQISETALNYRLRAQSSVNLGGWLVTEKWLKPGLYDCTGNDKVGELNLAANCDVVSAVLGMGGESGGCV
jgi:hypothetical protein